ncbi:MAG: hypothetical protein PHV97_02950 [Candidatus Omnitrophica bacterium]|nr:hypothetical protein [Candidatus Omnitrophota bacterium]
MKNVEKTELLDHLAQYGYALAVPKSSVAPEKVLVELLRQDDARLLEGFPVVLANALSEKETLAWEDKKWSPEKVFSVKMQKRWAALIALSLLLFRLFGVSKGLEDRVFKLLRKYPQGEQTLAALEQSFSGSGQVRAGGMELSAERLKNSFRNYVVHQNSAGALREQKDALGLELLLSELFTLRQKELLAKQLEGKKFTKTEQEYYCRVVKKRLKALADERVHQMARKLVFS